MATYKCGTHESQHEVIPCEDCVEVEEGTKSGTFRRPIIIEKDEE